MKKIYLFANWKMYLDFDESNILANALVSQVKNLPDNLKMAVFPSALSFYAVNQALGDADFKTGAQNVYWVDKGGYTGEISATMYKTALANYALIGHSERRHQFYESNTDTRHKIEASISAGLIPVLCVGETLEEKNKGLAQEVVEAQLRAALADLKIEKNQKIFIAYEPVWSIGTGESCDAEIANSMQAKIKEWSKALLPKVEFILLYGGSVRGENVANYLRESSIDGVLVGGASAKLESWLEIISAASAI